MKTRIITSIVGLTVLALVLVFFQTPIYNLVLACVSLIAIHEAYEAFQIRCKPVFAAFIPATLWLFLGQELFPGSVMWPVLYLLVLFLACAVIARVHTLSFAAVSGMMMLAGMIVACFYSLLYLRSCFEQTWEGLYAVLLVLAFAWGGDSCAYFAGCALGKHKLAPQVSPKKTIEGAVGGIAGSVVLGLVITAIFTAIFGPNRLLEVYGAGYYVAIALVGAVSSVLGILGDLTASAVKRQCEIKDYGTIFPGHGGILDRFDSVMLIAPFITICVFLELMLEFNV